MGQAIPCSKRTGPERQVKNRDISSPVRTQFWAIIHKCLNLWREWSWARSLTPTLRTLPRDVHRKALRACAGMTPAESAGSIDTGARPLADPISQRPSRQFHYEGIPTAVRPCVRLMPPLTLTVVQSDGVRVFAIRVNRQCGY